MKPIEVRSSRGAYHLLGWLKLSMKYWNEGGSLMLGVRKPGAPEGAPPDSVTLTGWLFGPTPCFLADPFADIGKLKTRPEFTEARR